jgi:hypothetical protein
MLFTWLGCFFLGIIWDLLVAWNTKLIADKSPNYSLIFVSSVIMTLVWGFAIKSITIDQYLIIPYAFACGFGSIAGVILHKYSSRFFKKKPNRKKRKAKRYGSI